MNEILNSGPNTMKIRKLTIKRLLNSLAIYWSYSGTSISKRPKGLAKYVCYRGFVLFEVPFHITYSAISGAKNTFVTPRTLLNR